MQGSARQDLLFSLHHSIVVRFVCLADMPLSRFCHEVIPCDLSADEWLDVSLVLDGIFWVHGFMMDCDKGYIPGWGLLADSQ